MKALVIQPAFLGDVIISLALAEELRRLAPRMHISYLVRPESAPILKLSPSVDEIFTFDKYGADRGLQGIDKKAQELNRHEFDVVFTLHASKRTRILLSKLHGSHKIGYGIYEELTVKLTEIIEQQSSRAVRLLTPVFPEADLSALPKLIPIETALSSQLASVPRPIVTISPESVWNTKKWPIERFKQVADRLSAANATTVLIGFTKDNSLIESCNLLFNNSLNYINKTSLEELVSIISLSDLLISNDSAPVHIATALRTKTLVLFGPTIPEFGFGPPDSLGKVLQLENLWCRPCTSHGSNECPVHTHECMNGISETTAYNAAISLLGA